MRFLLDENLEAIVAETASVYAARNSDDFIHIGDIGALGVQDQDIPELASDHQCDCLITVNVKDFGAKKFYYEAMLAHGFMCVSCDLAR